MRIKAKVLDVNNEPLMGANVLVINDGIKTNVGASTGFDGTFTIDNSLLTNNSVLQVSYVGFETVNITIPKLIQESLHIYLVETGIEGSEVVIYGTKPVKKDFNWWWLLLAIPLGYGIYKATEKQPKKVTL